MIPIYKYCFNGLNLNQNITQWKERIREAHGMDTQMSHYRKSVFPGDNPLWVHVGERGVVRRISETLKWDIYGHTVAALMLLTTVIGLGSVCHS